MSGAGWGAVRGAKMQANLSQWREHKTEKGQVYLSNPDTGEVKWLWTRHHDRRTGRDYLVNGVSGERVWATRENAHLCPRPAGARPQSAPVRGQTPSAGAAPRVGGARYREIARAGAGIGPDEVVMEEVGTGKRFVSNRRTGQSRWLSAPASAGPSPRPHAVPAPQRQSVPGGSQGPRRMPPPRPANGAGVNGRRLGAMSGNPNAAALLLQRAYRAFAVRRVRVIEKLTVLEQAVRDIDKLAAPGTKFDLVELRRVAGNKSANPEAKKAANDSLLQLGEVVTQAMLKVDGVESAGLSVIRNKRKKSVKKLLGLTENIEEMRAQLKK